MAIGIFELVALAAAPDVADVLAIVDVSDSTQAPQGSTKKITTAFLFTTPNITTSATITGASAVALAVGRLGATTPAFTVDASTASQVAGLKVVGAVTGGTVQVVATDSGSNTNVTLNAKGSGTIGIGSVSTGDVTVTPHSVFVHGLQITGAPGGAGAGDIFKSATQGLGVLGITGSAFDFTLLTPGGSTILTNTTGTQDMVFAGAVAVTTTLGVTGNVAVNTNKFTVTAASGNTTVAGTLDVTGSTTVGLSSASSNLAVSGGGAAISTSATAGFLFITSCAGTPTGNPTLPATGNIPLVIDTSAGKLWARYGGSWHFATLI